MNFRHAISKVRIKFEDEVLTAPSKSFNLNLYGLNSDFVAAKVEELHKNGYVSLGLLLSSEQQELIKSLVDSAIDGKIQEAVVKWHESSQYWQVFNPLRLDKLFLELSVNSNVLAIAEGYFSRPVFLADVDMRRVMPAKDENIFSNIGYSSSSWHRDTRGRQLKMMVYLSDVGEKDSCFSFLPKTHSGNYPRKNTYMESRFSDDSVEKMGIERIDWLGKAGEAYLFDTNLIHRLCRKPEAKLRDSFTCYFTPGQELRDLDFSDLQVQDFPPEKSRVFGNPTNRLLRSRISYKE